MRRLILNIVILAFAFSAAQAQKYKDIFPQLVSADDDNAFEILNDILIEEQDHPNANLRIAKIYINRYKSTDVLREYDRALALAEQAKFKLIKAKVTIDDREVKKNEEYYMGILPDGQFSYQAIDAYINQESAAVEAFMEYLPPIYAEFVRSVEKYDEVVKEFADIVGSHASLKELYLLYNQKLGDRLNNLKSNYDSTKYYFDNYLALRNGYQVNAVKQSYTEKPIKVYRLDGLVTQINFLQPNITLWDYASWVDTVNTVVTENIASLRKDLVSNDIKLKAAIEKVNTLDNPDSFKIVKVDKALMFNLMRYDYKNALVPFLAYQEYKQQIIKEQKRKAYFDTASIAVDRKLAYFSNMMYDLKHADSIITEFEVRYDPEQLIRHQSFITEAFGSEEAMKKYMSDEKVANKRLFTAQVTNIKNGILSSIPVDTAGVEVKYRRTIIPTFIVQKPLAELDNGYIKTNFLIKSADENLYVAGHQVTDLKNLNTEIAVAKLSPENKPLWVKAIDLEIDSAGVDASHRLGDIKLTSEGLVMIVRSVALDSSKVINSLVHLTSDGDIKYVKRLSTELYPREINYLEESNMFIVSFFGENQVIDEKVQNNLSVRAINGLGEEIWHYDNIFNGDYQQTIPLQTGILVGGNYTQIKNEAGRTITAASGTNAYLISLSLSGGLEKIGCYSNQKSYQINTFYKVSDRNINLIGTNGEQLIVDRGLEIVYSSLVPN